MCLPAVIVDTRAGSMPIACKSAERANHVLMSCVGLPPSFARDTCRTIAAMAGYAMRQVQAKAHASRHAAARKSLRHLSKALRSQLKVLLGQQMRLLVTQH
jgi:hypothetical protein